MPTIILNALIIFFLLSVAIGLIDTIMSQNRQRTIVFFAGLIIGYFVLSATTEFPFPSGRQAFGAAFSPLLAVLLMFGSVALGIAATYIFHLSGRFSWRDFARPMVVSPLILLPLIGSLQGAALEPVQLICFVILSFQNGFFWQQVLRDAKATTR